MAFGGISDRRILRSRPVKVRGNDAIRTRCIGLGTRSIWPSVPSFEWINGARVRAPAYALARSQATSVRCPAMSASMYATIAKPSVRNASTFPDRAGGGDGLDETSSCHPGRGRHQAWFTEIADVGTGRLLDGVQGRDVAGPHHHSNPAGSVTRRDLASSVVGVA